ncbi:uncharacterized protein BJX67DRAFT_378764 [Aspergillus lucknowensis]|uniref:Uncharacterized protein n=1 Tax=Aspergillus lucknowensis TaxID=176173 RepID=A0ABR4LYS9_9EURO
MHTEMMMMMGKADWCAKCNATARFDCYVDDHVVFKSINWNATDHKAPTRAGKLPKTYSRKNIPNKVNGATQDCISLRTVPPPTTGPGSGAQAAAPQMTFSNSSWNQDLRDGQTLDLFTAAASTGAVGPAVGVPAPIPKPEARLPDLDWTFLDDSLQMGMDPNAEKDVFNGLHAGLTNTTTAAPVPQSRANPQLYPIHQSAMDSKDLTDVAGVTATANYLTSDVASSWQGKKQTSYTVSPISNAVPGSNQQTTQPAPFHASPGLAPIPASNSTATCNVSKKPAPQQQRPNPTPNNPNPQVANMEYIREQLELAHRCVDELTRNYDTDIAFLKREQRAVRRNYTRNIALARHDLETLENIFKGATVARSGKRSADDPAAERPGMPTVRSQRCIEREGIDKRAADSEGRKQTEAANSRAIAKQWLKDYNEPCWGIQKKRRTK